MNRVAGNPVPAPSSHDPSVAAADDGAGGEPTLPVPGPGPLFMLRHYGCGAILASTGPLLALAKRPIGRNFHEGAYQAVPRRRHIAPATHDGAECTRHDDGRGRR